MGTARLFLLFILIFASCRSTQRTVEAGRSRWSTQDAQQWSATHGWLRGSNFIPSNAINELEMWQGETFDTATIDRELALAESLGFNSMRVFLHDLLWKQDSSGFLQRIDKYLQISSGHGIGTMFVLFDGVWNPEPKAGKQPAPRPFVHNSGWVQSPGSAILSDTVRQDSLQNYVQGIIGHFSKDPRVDAWDLFNEPDNMYIHPPWPADPANKAALATRLLGKAFSWARAMNPSQPLTAGLWNGGDWSNGNKLSALSSLMVNESDIISFHCYDPKAEMEKRIRSLQTYGRPIVCTEYMARPNKSTFADILPLLKESNVGAYNWGFVSGKTNTVYPWNSWDTTYTAEPVVWFHDIFRGDGTPYKLEEIETIKQLTGKK
ncbi:MAG TPA: hypothetical protein VLC28_03435 [Flavitalea sp.]|nr:hypothetical protein [Flavitalea sp.]